MRSGLFGSMFVHLCYFRRVGLFRVAIKKTRVMLVYPRGFACFQLFCRFPRAVARCACSCALRVLGAVFGSFPRIALLRYALRACLTHLAACESCFASRSSRVARGFSLCVCVVDMRALSQRGHSLRGGSSLSWSHSSLGMRRQYGFPFPSGKARSAYLTLGVELSTWKV